jgi:predicted alpha-1,2-mannosidase
MPYAGELKWIPGDSIRKGYSSAFKHKNETGHPGYYSVLLDDYNIKAELTATEHCGMHRYSFPENKPYNLIVDLFHSLDKKRPYWSCKIISSQVRIINNNTIEGYRIITGWARLRKVYFRAEFSRPFSSDFIKAGRNVFENVDVGNDTDLKLNLIFNENNSEPLIVKVGLSSVSQEGAKENLEQEISGFDFDKVSSIAESKWNEELSCIDIDGTDVQKRIFYTGLYHAFIQPNNIADKSGNYINQNFEVSKAPDGVHYSTFSLWDTYRAAHPLYTLVQKKRDADFINSMLRQYMNYGYLPIWQLWGEETYCMIGNHAIPVIVDAYFKGLEGVDWNLAYDAVKSSSTTPHKNSTFDLLNKYGYFPENLQTQSVSLTLEIAYNDWCTAQFAKALGKNEDYDFFIKRSENYKNLFDKSIGFFRAKDNDGKWIEPFNPLKYGGNGGYPFTEGNGWQYLWYVPHNVYKFIDLMGGKEKFSKKLDEFFTLEAKPEDVNGNASGFIGQYAHGNEPSQQIIYFYNFTNEAWKTQFYSAKVMNEQYTDSPSGYSGNEDCGQMSAWYILSSMGFYPVNPANGIYCIGSPQLAKAVIHNGSGKDFTILANNANSKNKYIQSANLNGKEYDKSYITHKDIMNGGTLEFTMGEKPNKDWGKGIIPE